MPRSSVFSKFITQPFIHFKDKWWEEQTCQINTFVEERIEREQDKYIAINRFHPKRKVYVKCSIHTRHSFLLNSISLKWISKYVSVNGQIVVRTCQSGSFKYHKYQDGEPEVEEQMEGWHQTRRNDGEQSWGGTKTQGWTEDCEWSHQHWNTKKPQKRQKIKVKAAADESSNTLTATFQFAWDVTAVTMKLKWVKAKIRKEDEEPNSTFEALTVTIEFAMLRRRIQRQQWKEKRQQKQDGER